MLGYVFMAMSSSGSPLYIGGGQSAPKSSLPAHPRQMEEPKVQGACLCTYAKPIVNFIYSI